MKSVEFKSTQITVPRELRAKSQPGEQLQIVVLWRTPTMDDTWNDLGRRRFEAAYGPEDSVYEQLMDSRHRIPVTPAT